MRSLAPVVALVLAVGLSAQNTFVLPTGYDVKRAESWNYHPYYGSTSSQMPGHVQYIYDTAKFPIPVAQLKALAFRRPRQLGNNNPAATADLVVSISVGPNDAASSSATFAANLGANPMTVFQAKLNLPAEYGGGTGIAPYSIVIPFAQPYPFAVPMGAGFVVDISINNYTGTAPWYMDAMGIQSGQWAYALSSFAGLNCVYSNSKGSAGGGTLSATLYPGGSFYFYQSGMPANLAGFVILGSRGPGSKWGPIQLPLDLGFLGAGSCALGVSMEITLPSSTDATGMWRWPTINIPNNPALGGFSIFEQAIYVDPGANAAGLVTTFVMEWPIGSGARPGGAIIYKYKDTTPPSATGSKAADRVIVTQFTF